MMNKEKLQAILREHSEWVWSFGEEGVRANLEDADLSYTDLRYENLSGADLRYANLMGVDLSYADLAGTDLIKTDLTGANLIGADLRYTLTEGMKGKSVISVQVDTSRPNNIFSYWVDLGVWTTGCFQGTLEELKEKIEETHKDNTFLRERYYRAIHFILQEADEDSRRIEGK